MSSPDKKVLKRLTAHYSLIHVMLNAIYLAIVGFSSVFLRYRGMNDMQIGILLAMGTVLSIITQPVLGSLADKMKNLRLSTVTAVFHIAMIPLAVFLMAFSKHVVPVAIAFMLLRYLISASDPFETSMAMEMVNHGYPVNFGLARGIGSAGYAVSSFLMGKAVAGWGEEVIMPCVIVLSLITTVILFTFRLPAGAKALSETEKKQQEKETLGLFDFMRKNLRFCIFILGVALLFYCHEVRADYMYQIMLNIGCTAEQYGTITAYTATVEMPAMLCFSLLLKRFRARTLMLFSAVCLVLRTLVICYAPNLLWMYLGATMQVVSYGLFVPSSVYYVNELVGEANRNKGQTFLSMGMSISAVLATLIGGTMLNAAGGDPHNMLLCGAIISAVGAVAMFCTASKPSAAPKPADK